MGARVRRCLQRVIVVACVGVLVVGFASAVQAHEPVSVAVECAAAAWGGPEPSNWVSASTGAVDAGSIGWPVLRTFALNIPASGYRARRGLARGIKGLVAVSRGHVVRVVVPAFERTRLSLDYTTLQPRAMISGYAYYRVSDGANEAVFHACPQGDRWTPFAGFFIVAGAQCAVLDIYTTASTQPLVRRVPFGVPGRSCPAIG